MRFIAGSHRSASPLLPRYAQPPTPEFFRARIINSINRRRAVFGTASACRLIFGEGDLLPGIIVDRYGDYLVLQTLSSSADALKSMLVDFLKDSVRPKGILERTMSRCVALKVLKKSAVFYGARSPMR